MGGLSIWHWIIVLVIVLVLFGRGRISEVMGDFGKGIKSFKEGINEESGDRHAPAAPPPPPVQIAPQPVAPAAAPEPVVPNPEAPVSSGVVPGVAPLPGDVKTGV